jgi:hypothetical protein
MLTARLLLLLAAVSCCCFGLGSCLVNDAAADGEGRSADGNGWQQHQQWIPPAPESYPVHGNNTVSLQPSSSVLSSKNVA